MMQLLATETLARLPSSILPRLVTIFASTSPALLDEIQQAASHDDLLKMAKAAHNLKGSCLSLGAEHMAQLCKELQEKGETNQAAGIQEPINELIQLYPATLAALQSFKA
jgi:hypothetical protein